MNWKRRAWFVFENLLAFAVISYVVFQMGSCAVRLREPVKEVRK